MKNLREILILLTLLPSLALAATPSIPSSTTAAPAASAPQKPASFSDGLDNWLDKRRCLQNQRKTHLTVTYSIQQKNCNISYTQARS